MKREVIHSKLYVSGKKGTKKMVFSEAYRRMPNTELSKMFSTDPQARTLPDVVRVGMAHDIHFAQKSLEFLETTDIDGLAKDKELEVFGRIAMALALPSQKDPNKDFKKKIWERLSSYAERFSGTNWREGRILFPFELIFQLAERAPNIEESAENPSFQTSDNFGSRYKYVIEIAKRKPQELPPAAQETKGKLRTKIKSLQERYSDLSTDAIKLAILADRADELTNIADVARESIVSSEIWPALKVKLLEADLPTASSLIVSVMPDAHLRMYAEFLEVLTHHYDKYVEKNGVLPEEIEDLLKDESAMRGFADIVMAQNRFSPEELRQTYLEPSQKRYFFDCLFEYADQEQIGLFAKTVVRIGKNQKNSNVLFMNLLGMLAISRHNPERSEKNIQNTKYFAKLIQKETTDESYESSIKSMAEALCDETQGIIVALPEYGSADGKGRSAFAVFKKKPKDAIELYRSAVHQDQEPVKKSKSNSAPVVIFNRQKEQVDAGVAERKKPLRIVDGPIFPRVDVFGSGVVLDPQEHKPQFNIFMEDLAKATDRLTPEQLFDELEKQLDTFRKSFVTHKPGSTNGENIPEVFHTQSRRVGIRGVIFRFIKGDGILSSVQDLPLIGYVPVSTESNQVLFAVNPSSLHARNGDKEGLVFLRGTINDMGELVFRGKDDDPEFAASKEHLFLNLMALRHYAWPAAGVPRREDRPLINDLLQSWKQGWRHFNEGRIVLPELRFNEATSGIPVVVNGSRFYLDPA